MCIIFFIKDSPQYKLIIAANRDEFLDRPSHRAHFWSDNPHILGGIDAFRDINSHGTWMGISKTGNFSFITNKRQNPFLIKKNMESRGLLVKDFLRNGNPREYCNNIQQNNYNGYFLVVGNVNDGMYLTSNDEHDPMKLYTLESNTIYGLSNGKYKNNDWPKVVNGKIKFEHIINDSKNKKELVENLIKLLQDTSMPSKEDLPEPVYNEEIEQLLAPICVECKMGGRRYATRTHTVILVDYDDNVYFEEIDRFKGVQNNDGINWESGNFSVNFEFNLDTKL